MNWPPPAFGASPVSSAYRIVQAIGLLPVRLECLGLRARLEERVSDIGRAAGGPNCDRRGGNVSPTLTVQPRLFTAELASGAVHRIISATLLRSTPECFYYAISTKLTVA